MRRKDDTAALIGHRTWCPSADNNLDIVTHPTQLDADTDLMTPDVSKTTDHPLILHVRVMSGYGGGPEKTILNSPRFLRELGYSSSCAYMHPPEDPGFDQLCQRAENARAEVISIADRGPLDWKVIRQLIRICREQQVAVWHGHDYKSNALGLLVRRFWPMKLITTVHGWVDRTSRTPLYYYIDKLCLRRYDQVLCVSDDLLEECKKLGLPSSRCHLIQNAIDTDEFQRSHDLEASNRPFRLGAVGRLSPEKGFDLLIKAVKQLKEEGRNLTLQIAGDGRDRERLAGEIDNSGLKDDVQLAGFVDNPKQFIEELDLFVLSSLREGLPNVLLEAMSLETPVVATRVAGVPKLIHNEVNGLLVESDSVEELVAGIRRMMDDQGLRSRLAQSGRETIVSEYSFRDRMRKIATIYDRELGLRIKL